MTFNKIEKNGYIFVLLCWVVPFFGCWVKMDMLWVETVNCISILVIIPGFSLYIRYLFKSAGNASEMEYIWMLSPLSRGDWH